MIFASTRYKPKRKSRRAETGLAPKLSIKSSGKTLKTGPTNHLFSSDQTKKFGSINTSDSYTLGKKSARYEDEEMMARELVAREEIKRKEMMVMPLHKGNYVYVGPNPGTDMLHGAGRKNAVL